MVSEETGVMATLLKVKQPTLISQIRYVDMPFLP